MIRTIFRQLFRGVWDLGRHPWPQAMALAAVCLAAFLAGLFLLLLGNLDRELHARHGLIQFQMYWKVGLDAERYKAGWKEARTLPRLEDMRTFTPEEALRELGASLGSEMDAEMLKGSKTALPATALLTFAAPDDDPEFPNRTFEALKKIADVDSVHFNPAQMDLARSWLTLSKRFLWPLIVLLGLVAGLIVGNTIKLAQVSRRDEVDILRLVGATQWYIELPMLAAGAFQGVVGSALGLGLLKLFQLSVRNLINVPPLFLVIDYPPLPHVLALAAGLTLVSLAASWVAVRR